jgi:prepilin-type N-terminal cleavage/methylation domain-containing protein
MRMIIYRSGGFTLVEIMIVVAIIGLLSAIALPNFIKARQTTQANACIENLREIDASIQQYALEANLPSGASVLPLSNLSPYLGHRAGGATINGGITPNSINCPANGTYVVTLDSVEPTCSLFASGHALP